MTAIDVFMSVGSTSTIEQEAFVRALEDRLRADGIVPHTVGRNTFSSDAPLKTVVKLLDRCAGTVVVAFERTFFRQGLEKRGGTQEKKLSDVRLPTPWNHIEAAMAYSREHPLMVIVEEGLRKEGLLEPGYDWNIQYVDMSAASLSTSQFNGVLADWKNKLLRRCAHQERSGEASVEGIGNMTVGELVRSLKPAQLWSVLLALAALTAGAFGLGAQLCGVS